MFANASAEADAPRKEVGIRTVFNILGPLTNPVLASAFILLITIWPIMRLGSEFMPPLDEGTILYMPTTDPGISITKARELLEQTDRLIKTVPEVSTVFGKSGARTQPPIRLR